MKVERPSDVLDIDVGGPSDRPDRPDRRAPTSLPPQDRSAPRDERLFPEVGEVDVARIAKGVMARWRQILLVALAVVGAGIYPVYKLLAPNYVSRAAISSVERSALLEEPWAPPPGPRLNETSLLELVESRAVMERAAKYLDEDIPLTELRLRIGIEWPRDQDVFFITAGLATQEEAKEWADAASRAFLDLAHERFRKDLQQAIERLETKVAKAREELDTKTQAVITYRQEHAITGTDAAPDELIKQLVELESRIAELRALGQADQKAAGAIRVADEPAPAPGGGTAAPTVQEDTEDEDHGGGGGMSRTLWRSRVSRIRSELAELERRYTSEHPRVSALRAELSDLMQLERTGRVARARRTEGGVDTSHRPEGWTAEEMALSAEHRLDQAATLEKSATELRRRIDMYTLTRRQLEVLEAEAATAKERWQKDRDDLDKANALMSLRAPLYDVVKEADLPDRPEGGKRRIATAALLLFGLGLGVGIALLRAVRDTSIRSVHDVERLGVTVLAGAVLGPSSLGRTAHREAMRLVAQTLRRELRPGGESRCVLVTSPNPNEGKSQIAADVCKELIRWGEGVVLVDANLRGGEAREGQLDGYLVGRVAKLTPAADEWGIPKVTSGNVGDEAPELLSRHGLRRAVRVAASRGFTGEGDEEQEGSGPGFRPAGATGNLCILDGPAFLPSVDGELLAEASDAVLLVVRRGTSRIEHVQEVVSRLRDAGRPIVATVLASADEKRNPLARLLLGPKHAVLALFALATLLGAAGCAPSRNLAEDTIEESNEEFMRQDARFREVAGEAVDLAPYRQVPEIPYVIGAGDVLEIVVIGYPEATRGGVLVRPDGRIGVPLVGDVIAAGATPESLGTYLTQELGRYLKGPVVAVLVQQARNARVLVLGMVRTPGTYVLSGPTRLVEVLAMAGGLVYRDELGAEPVVADLARATLMRGGQVIPVDFGRLLAGGDEEQNIYVRPGDVIHLPPLHERDVLVLGEVEAPTVLRYSPRLTLAGALARAGGVTLEARTGAVRVIRGSLARPRVYLVDSDDIFAAQREDVPLLPGDIVYVTSTVLADWNRILQQILPTIQALLTTRYLIEGTPRPLYDWGN